MNAISRPVGRPRVTPLSICEVCGRAFPGQSRNANRFCSNRCLGRERRTPEFIAAALALWNEGHAESEIGRRLGVTKAVIAGINYRNNFPTRRR